VLHLVHYALNHLPNDRTCHGNTTCKTLAHREGYHGLVEDRLALRVQRRNAVESWIQQGESFMLEHAMSPLLSSFIAACRRHSSFARRRRSHSLLKNWADLLYGHSIPNPLASPRKQESHSSIMFIITQMICTFGVRHICRSLPATHYWIASDTVNHIS
jgi:hypothetical protein